MKKGRIPEGSERLQTRLTLRPGQNGTKKLQQKYGNRLLTVRYRYDPVRRLRIKTVEIIEEELPWAAPPRTRAVADEWVLVRLDYGEVELRNTVKNYGGLWQPQRKLWKIPYPAVHQLGLEDRIVA